MVSAKFNHRTAILESKFEGELTVKELIECSINVKENATYPRFLKKLIDSKNAFVNISINITDNNCEYIVENNKLPPKTEDDLTKSGIGLLNVKRRLELSYPEKYKLNVTETDTRYLVNLSLTL